MGVHACLQNGAPEGIYMLRARSKSRTRSLGRRSLATFTLLAVLSGQSASAQTQTASQTPTQPPSEAPSIAGTVEVGGQIQAQTTVAPTEGAAPTPATAPSAVEPAASKPVDGGQAEPSATATTAPGAETAAAPESESAVSPTDNVDVDVDVPAGWNAPTSESDSPTPTASKLPWALRNRRYNTMEGSTGGIHLQDPSSGAINSIRLQLVMDSFSGNDFLYDKDSVQQVGQSLSLSWTVSEYVELYAAMYNRTTSIYREFERDSDTGIAPPAVEESASVLGDLTLGIKLSTDVTPILRLGGSLHLAVHNAVADTDAVLEATGIGLTGAAALDLTGLANPIPLIARLNLGYYFDNSGSLIEGIEEDRYNDLADPADEDEEYAHLINRFDRFALGISRVDMLNIGLGVELPLELGVDTYLYPMLEWSMGLPVNRQGYDCPLIEDARNLGTIKNPNDNCAGDAGSVVYPQLVSVGMRFAPPVRGLSAFAALDVAVTGTKEFARETTPLAGYRILLGLAYGYDAEPPPPPPPAPAPVVETVEAPPAPAFGRVMGTVVDAGTGMPLADAQVRFLAHNLSTLVTSELGTFVSYLLDPGLVTIEVSHPDYGTAQCTATIAAEGGDTKAQCGLAKIPARGNLDILARDPFGNPIGGALLQLTGREKRTLTAGPRGHVAVHDLLAGNYRVLVEAPGHLARVINIAVQNRMSSQSEVTMALRSPRPKISVAGDRVKANSLRFVGDTTGLINGGDESIAELADLLLQDNALLRIRIQAPGAGALSLTRGLLIRQRLIDAGIDGTRIEALGGAPRGPVSITVVERPSL